jgi:hypothetical protein
MTMLKGKPQSQPANAGNAPAQFRDNAEINSKIDAYIKNNPKEWAYIQSMPPERMARTIVLQAVNKKERQERIRSSVLRKLEENPELKQAYQTLVKNLPADQQEKMMANLAMRTSRSLTPRQPVTQAQKA